MSEILLILGLGGCNLTPLNPLLWDALRKLLPLWNTNPLIITATWDGTHLPYSYHYSADALDIRKPPQHSPEFYAQALTAIGPTVKLLNEETHYHLQTMRRRIAREP